MTSPSTPDLAPLAKATLHDRLLGALVGSALGDAVGLYTEFLNSSRAASEYPSGSFTLSPTPTPFARDMHRLKHQLGDWTDDTDHALLLLLSFLHTSSSSPSGFAARLHVWVAMGIRALDSLPLGLGATVGAIVRDPSFLSDPVRAAHDRWRKGSYNVAPNGSIMRTHPLGLTTIFKGEEEAMDRAAEMSAVTHVDPRCVVACMIQVALVRGLVRGEVSTEEHIDAVIQRAVARYNGSIRPAWIQRGPFTDDEPGLDLDELRKHTHAASVAEPLDTSGIGYVYKALGSGLLLLRQAMRRTEAAPSPVVERTRLFQPVITELVMAGGDADTNACVAGALLGAYTGYAALPAHWRDGLRKGDWLVAKGEGLSRMLGVAEGEYDGANDPDTEVYGGKGPLTEDQMERRWMELQARMAAENTAHQQAEAKKAQEGKSFFKLW